MRAFEQSFWFDRWNACRVQVKTVSIDRLLTIIGIVLAVGAAWYFSWYFYKASLPTRIPSYLVDPVRAALAGGSGADTSDITILYKGSSIGKKAVNVVRVYFWNAGNTPITKAEILDPYAITISPDSEILEAKTLKVSRDLTFITCDPDEYKRNTANVNFDVLESNDGAALQITYAGPSDAKLEFHGATVGAPSPTPIEITDYSQKIFNSLSSLEKVVSKNKYVVSFSYLGLVLILSSPIIIPYVRNFIYRRLFRSKKTDREIEDSAMRALLPAIVVLLVVGSELILIIPREITEAIPSALIVKD
jgi:hypothetical protein